MITTGTSNDYTQEITLFRDMTTGLMGLSWVALVLAPWAMIAFAMNHFEFTHFSQGTMSLMASVLIAAIPQFIACLDIRHQDSDKHKF